jgi:serine/threonine-protein kinase
VSRVYHLALARSPEERPALLSEACGDDAVLRREVESLLTEGTQPDALQPGGGLRAIATIRSSGSLVGERLGSYVVRSFIGQGGMGEVYKAEDTRLNRTVAIKVLPPEVRHDAGRRDRLEREAKALAALSHPHICPLFDVGHQDGTDFLVMEYLEGETLAARLERGKLPLDQVFRHGVEIADALAAAHRQGVIHRDLKPGNIMLTRSGAKLLDFGLASRPLRDPSSSGIAVVATLTLPGSILGTPRYMAPEQIEGKEADARSDVFAFGAVLYEMATGTRAFDGDSAAAVMAAVLEHEPPALSSREPLSPAAFDRLIRTCLAKNPDARWQSAADLARELRWIATAPAEASGVRDSRERSRLVVSRRDLMWATGATAAALVGGGTGWLLQRTASSRMPDASGSATIVHLPMPVQPAGRYGENSPFSSRPSRTDLAVSPNGELVVFVGRATVDRYSAHQLYLRHLGGQASPIPGTQRAQGPFFSPDGTWIGFWAQRRIMKVRTDGGPTAPVLDLPAPGPFGASWGKDDHIYFSQPLPQESETGIWKVHAAGGAAAVAVTRPELAKRESHVLPHVLPDGRAILFTRIGLGGWEEAEVVLHELDTGESRVLLKGAVDARYVASGFLTYLKMGTLIAELFDLSKHERTGVSIPLAEDVMQAINTINSNSETGAGQYAISPTTLLYVTGGIFPPLEKTVVWLDRQGVATPVPSTERTSVHYRSPRLSPDERRIAVVLPGAATRSTEIWTFPIVPPGEQRLNTRGRRNWPVVWSPDGERLAYSSNESGFANIYVCDASGGDAPVQLTDKRRDQYPSSWVRTSSGKQLLAFVERIGRRHQIWVGSIEGDTLKAKPFLDDPRHSYTHPDLSPDGRWLAYVSNENKMVAVSVRPYPGPGSPIRISSEGGTSPVWVSSGRELVYQANYEFYSVSVRSLDPFRAEPARHIARRVGETHPVYEMSSPVREYDLSRDGQRILIPRLDKSINEPVTHINVVSNWTERLKARAPTR